MTDKSELLQKSLIQLQSFLGSPALHGMMKGITPAINEAIELADEHDKPKVKQCAVDQTKKFSAQKIELQEATDKLNNLIRDRK